MDSTGPRLSFPPLTHGIKVLMLVNVAVFAVSFVLTFALEGSLLDRPFSHELGFSWTGITDGYGLGLLRVFSYMFAHSYGDPWHIAGNMLLLYFFGFLVEGEVGRRGIYHLYVVCGLMGAIGHLGLAALLGSLSVPLIGASGSCYGIMVYAACMAPRARTFFGLEMRWLVGILVAIGVYMSLLELRGHAMQDVSHGAHLGGSLGGFLAFKKLRYYYLGLNHRDGPLFPWLDRWKADRGRRKEEDLQATLDRLLEKVSREGMSALTSGERRQLERVSKELKKR